MVLTWVLAFTLVPFGYDVNSITFLDIYSSLLLGQLIGAILYMVFFTFEFSLVLYRFYHTSSINSSVLKEHKVIAIKSILHCFTSTIGNILYVYIPIFGPLLYNIVIIAGIHFLFNFKIEKYLYISKWSANNWNFRSKVTPCRGSISKRSMYSVRIRKSADGFGPNTDQNSEIENELFASQYEIDTSNACAV
jgi:hypothetical protein